MAAAELQARCPLSAVLRPGWHETWASNTIYRYRIVHKGSHFTDRFFDYLTRIGREDDLTEYQQLYNQQDKNFLDVTGPVLLHRRARGREVAGAG